MKQYTLLLAGTLLTACGDSTDVEEFEKQQANAAKDIAAQQVKMEEESISPCSWASLEDSCTYVEFGHGLYAIETPEGNILMESPLEAVKVSHKNFTNCVNVIVDYAATQNIKLTKETVEKAEKEYVKTTNGYILTVYTEVGDFHLMEDGRIFAKLN